LIRVEQLYCGVFPRQGYRRIHSQGLNIPEEYIGFLANQYNQPHIQYQQHYLVKLGKIASLTLSPNRDEYGRATVNTHVLIFNESDMDKLNHPLFLDQYRLNKLEKPVLSTLTVKESKPSFPDQQDINNMSLLPRDKQEQVLTGLLMHRQNPRFNTTITLKDSDPKSFIYSLLKYLPVSCRTLNYTTHYNAKQPIDSKYGLKVYRDPRFMVLSNHPTKSNVDKLVHDILYSGNLAEVLNEYQSIVYDLRHKMNPVHADYFASYEYGVDKEYLKLWLVDEYVKRRAFKRASKLLEGLE
jgi:hypothetical protein